MRAARATRLAGGRTRGLILVLVAAALMGAGCGASEQGGGGNDGDPKGSSAPADSELVIEGHGVGKDGLPTDPDLPASKAKARATTAARKRRDLSGVLGVATVEPPKLLGDGTIDDGPDPFDTGGAPTASMPLPIEDDVALTEALDTWRRGQGTGLQLVDLAAFQRWAQLDRTLTDSSHDESKDPSAPFVVRVLSKRCGGARTSASGVLMGGETVVTTVHAIESVERRVRVQLALDATERRYPAMIQYVDVDDDIAVLRVPGLTAAGIGQLSAVPSAFATEGFALGITIDGLGRVPVLLGGDRLSAKVEQPDGFGEQITDRDVHPMLGAVTTGYSGGPVVTSVGDDAGPWRMAGMVRARVPYRSLTASVVIPIDLIKEAIGARDARSEWNELVPRAGCSQWTR